MDSAPLKVALSVEMPPWLSYIEAQIIKICLINIG